MIDEDSPPAMLAPALRRTLVALGHELDAPLLRQATSAYASIVVIEEPLTRAAAFDAIKQE